MLFTAICSAFAALAFLLNWAITFHRHNPDWIALGVATVFGVTAVGWLIRWRRTPRTL
jgi:hypothetical protein